MQRTSGCTVANHSSTRSRRASRELTFQVTRRTAVTVPAPGAARRRYRGEAMEATAWSDYLCPWAYLGRDRTRLMRDLGVTVTVQAYELHPEIPAEGVAVRPGGRL